MPNPMPRSILVHPPRRRRRLLLPTHRPTTTSERKIISRCHDKIFLHFGTEKVATIFCLSLLTTKEQYIEERRLSLFLLHKFVAMSLFFCLLVEYFDGLQDVFRNGSIFPKSKNVSIKIIMADL